jgi:malate dehydrogenase (oxaloacetate-decarboxylating)
LAACSRIGQKLKDQKIVFCGAGAAGCGIAEQIVAEMVAEGLTDAQARERVYMINSRGLVIESMTGLKDFQQRLCQTDDRLKQWNIDGQTATLAETVEKSVATILVGVSAVNGLFTEEIVKQMAKNVPEPIILPLSNPTSKIEALPSDIFEWTGGKAIVATGSPFEPVRYSGKEYPIAQCNNSYIFPGLGLGIVASQAKRVTDNMLRASSHALATYAAEHGRAQGELLPALEDIRDVSLFIARAVYQQAIDDGVALTATDEVIAARIQDSFWEPQYRFYRRTAF